MPGHLDQLAVAANKRGAPVERVIFQQELVAQLTRARRGNDLRSSVTSMTATPWIRYNGH